MDYKRLKNQKSAVKRERALWITIAVLTAIIVVQIITAVFMASVINRYRAMYEESLNERLTMQEKINSLSGGGDASANYLPDNEENADAENNTDIPFVTEGKELQDESSINN